MGKYRYLLQRLADATELDSELLPGTPLVEIYGNSRVLIENHIGVLKYCSNEIRIKVKFGYICVTGCSLLLAHMSRERVVITGQIEGLNLCKGG